MMLRFALALTMAASLVTGAAQARQSPPAATAAADSAPAPAPGSAPQAAAQAVPQATPALPGSNVIAPRSPLAATPAPAPGPVGGVSAGNLMQTIFALILVLGLLAGLAWFLKRYGPKAAGGSAHMRVVGAVNLGGRERVIVVEVAGQWIVVGASPGRVNALATLPKPEHDDSAGATLHPHHPSASSFSDWLKQTIDKRNAK